ncbi:PstS family phosphate ABC transporter substrate-binding protein [Fuchsiella alkaliacetigena]|uniref:PstS family phosphate ABC transporter substrate-binding protein n=1 Tax=Fuchsiella alkaliacetigena TaxID=957042 RepID=UPI00200B19A2|nr:PstS family phosphate ABC transporter substrate-binding protein [Fuchsiella alkaliacetigena]MCK8824670.1 PstS family phosphate ABC transporter substrate-binding protein [Fuchsiella alkaliacetigena]
MLKKKVLAVFLALALVVGAGITFSGEADAFFGWFRSDDDQTYAQVRGSDTMVNLGQSLAESFMEQSDYDVSVTGGGSGTGIAALINNEVDIANVSREMSDSELEQAAANGVDVHTHVIAMDGLAVVVNENNPVRDLTIEEIGAIFRGDITNWSEVGGPDMEISMYGRQSNSGTYVFFRDNVLEDDYSDHKNRMNGTAQIIEGVLNDESAIGYGGIGYAVSDGEARDGLGVINVAVDEDSEYATPLEPSNVETGAYPLARPLFNYTNGEPAGAVLDYLKFAIGSEGQEVAVDTGFYPISPDFDHYNSDLE